MKLVGNSNSSSNRKVFILRFLLVDRGRIAEQIRSASPLVSEYRLKLEMWANAQGDGRPAEHRWRPLFNAAKFG